MYHLKKIAILSNPKLTILVIISEMFVVVFGFTAAK